MPAPEAVVWNLDVCQITLGTFRLSGFAPGDAVVISPNDDLVEIEEAGDGGATSISYKNSKGASATLRIKRGTTAYARVADLLQQQQQQAADGTVEDLPFQAYNPIDGTRVSTPRAFFTRRPELGFAQANGVAEFPLFLQAANWRLGQNL